MDGQCIKKENSYVVIQDPVILLAGGNTGGWGREGPQGWIRPFLPVVLPRVSQMFVTLKIMNEI